MTLRDPTWSVRPGGDVAVSVRDGNGRPVAGEQVVLRDRSGAGILARGISGADGQVTLRPSRPGRMSRVPGRIAVESVGRGVPVARAETRPEFGPFGRQNTNFAEPRVPAQRQGRRTGSTNDTLLPRTDRLRRAIADAAGQIGVRVDLPMQVLQELEHLVASAERDPRMAGAAPLVAAAKPDACLYGAKTCAEVMQSWHLDCFYCNEANRGIFVSCMVDRMCGIWAKFGKTCEWYWQIIFGLYAGSHFQARQVAALADQCVTPLPTEGQPCGKPETACGQPCDRCGPGLSCKNGICCGVADDEDCDPFSDGPCDGCPEGMSCQFTGQCKLRWPWEQGKPLEELTTLNECSLAIAANYKKLGAEVIAWKGKRECAAAS